jgi:hypothetical protein
VRRIEEALREIVGFGHGTRVPDKDRRMREVVLEPAREEEELSAEAVRWWVEACRERGAETPLEILDCVERSLGARLAGEDARRLLEAAEALGVGWPDASGDFEAVEVLVRRGRVRALLRHRCGGLEEVELKAGEEFRCGKCGGRYRLVSAIPLKIVKVPGWLK